MKISLYQSDSLLILKFNLFQLILKAQLDKAKDELVSEMKRDGVEYEQRMDALDKVTWPQPEADFLEPAFAVFAQHHPWVGHDRVSPKSVVRDMLEHGESFNQYVGRYGLKRSEGSVLRYLTDCYRAMVQTVPVDVVSQEFDDLTECLGDMIRRVDSSLLDEWETLRHGDSPEEAPPSDSGPAVTLFTENRRSFALLVRNAMFRIVTELATKQAPALDPQSSARLREQLVPYWEEHDSIEIDANARAAQWHGFDPESGIVTQTLCDPAGFNEWAITARVDAEASNEQEQVVLVSVNAERR